MLTRLRRRWAAEGSDHGAVFVMVVGMIVLLIGVTALAIDLGRYSVLRSRLQNAADMAATAGASAYDYDALRRGEDRLVPAVARQRAEQFLLAQDLTGLRDLRYEIAVVDAAGGCGQVCNGPDGSVFTAPSVYVRVQAEAGGALFGRIFGASEYRLDLSSAASLTRRFESGRS